MGQSGALRSRWVDTNIEKHVVVLIRSVLGLTNIVPSARKVIFGECPCGKRKGPRFWHRARQNPPGLPAAGCEISHGNWSLNGA
jgi:hypothetical protein